MPVTPGELLDLLALTDDEVAVSPDNVAAVAKLMVDRVAEVVPGRDGKLRVGLSGPAAKPGNSSAR